MVLSFHIQDCSIRINTSSALGFRDQDWAAIVITVRDFNKQPIHFGNNTAETILPGLFSLSSTAVQVFSFSFLLKSFNLWYNWWYFINMHTRAWTSLHWQKTGLYKAYIFNDLLKSVVFSDPFSVLGSGCGKPTWTRVCQSNRRGKPLVPNVCWYHLDNRRICQRSWPCVSIWVFFIVSVFFCYVSGGHDSLFSNETTERKRVQSHDTWVNDQLNVHTFWVVSSDFALICNNQNYLNDINNLTMVAIYRVCYIFYMLHI